MTNLRYDGSFEGLLTCVFEVYEHKLKSVNISTNLTKQDDLFAETWQIETNTSRANRVQTKIIELAGKQAFTSLWKAYLSELPTIENTILQVVQQIITGKHNVLSNYSNADVVALQKVLKKVSRERHRMTAFVRFQQATDQIYYAIIEPEFNVLPLIRTHFKNRFADQQWLIFDQHRNYGIFYNLEEVIVVEPTIPTNETDLALRIPLTDCEAEFQRLWQSYFSATGIAARKNTKLHLQHVPKRYWNYLTEKTHGK